MRNTIKTLRAHCDEFIRHGTRGLLVLADDGPQPCPICQGPTQVRKTSKVQVCKTLTYGMVLLWETFRECAADQPCRYPSGDLATSRSKVAQALIPTRQVGYDVMTFVGTKRYIDYQQRDEILDALEKQGVPIASGTESNLAALFTGYLRVLHENPRTLARLRQALADDGGYWIHIDATGENGRGTTAAVYVGGHHWVLEAKKISTENANEFLALLKGVIDQFGVPVAIVSDLGKGVLNAIRCLREELALKGAHTIHLICHLHFVRDIGKDLLTPSHNALGAAATNAKLKKHLKDIERDLSGLIGDKDTARDQVNGWLEQTPPSAPLTSLPSGIRGLSILRSLLQWTLDYRVQAHDDFPFSQKNLYFFQRCLKAREILRGYCQRPPMGAKLQSKLFRFYQLVDAFCGDPAVVELVARLKGRLALWEELRGALRLLPDSGAKSRTHVPPELPVEQAKVELQDIQSAVNRLRESYPARRPEASRDLQQAIDLIEEHLETYGHLLWGHVIKLEDGPTIVVARTNNRLEGFWGEDKHGERRRSGHRTLTQVLDTKPAAALLAHNLTCPDYVRLLCGTLEALPQAFAQLDTDLKQKAFAQKKPSNPKERLPRTVRELLKARSSEETARTQDKKLIRSKAYSAQLEALGLPQDTAPEPTETPEAASKKARTSEGRTIQASAPAHREKRGDATESSTAVPVKEAALMSEPPPVSPSTTTPGPDGSSAPAAIASAPTSTTMPSSDSGELWTGVPKADPPLSISATTKQPVLSAFAPATQLSFPSHILPETPREPGSGFTRRRSSSQTWRPKTRGRTPPMTQMSFHAFT